MSGIVIAGAGQAGLQLAASLRELGYAGPVHLLGHEPELPYQRPPLSKAFLKGKAGEDTLLLKPPAFFDKADIGIRVATRVTGIDRARKTVRLHDGTALAYDHLVLATGARNRTLPVEGADLAGVHALRDWADARILKAALPAARKIAVIGAGFIGLEFACVAREAGAEVSVIDVAPRVMARAVSPAISRHFEKIHRDAGIALHLTTSTRKIVGHAGRATAIECADGQRIAADLVVIGIGVVPNCEIAQECGLACDNGVRVDAALRTSDPAISAVGDCAAFPSALDDGQWIRLESVQNAVDQAKLVAARLARGTAGAYAAVPWFWTDQGSTRLQMAGVAPRSDLDVVRGNPETGVFSIFRFLDGRLRVVESVNAPHDHLAARRLVAPGVGLSPEEAADLAVDLKARALER